MCDSRETHQFADSSNIFSLKKKKNLNNGLFHGNENGHIVTMHSIVLLFFDEYAIVLSLKREKSGYEYLFDLKTNIN